MTSRARAWLWYAIAWLPFAVIYAIVILTPVPLRVQRPVVTLPIALFEGLTYIAPVALMGVAVWWLVGALAWPPRSTSRFIVVHIVAGTVFSMLWLVSQVSLIMLGTGFHF